MIFLKSLIGAQRKDYIPNQKIRQELYTTNLVEKIKECKQKRTQEFS